MVYRACMIVRIWWHYITGGDVNDIALYGMECGSNSDIFSVIQFVNGPS